MTRTRGPLSRSAVTALGGGDVGGSYRALEARTGPNDPDGVSPALMALSERQFQAMLVAGLRERGWTVWVVPNMKLTTAGLPDVLAWHPSRPGVLHAWELKRERDYRVTPAQRAALAHLETVPGIDARIVRPSQWEALRDGMVDPSDPRAREG